MDRSHKKTKLINANQTTREIYLKEINTIIQSYDIPDQWQVGEITRLYKGKGKKGKCSNERGITLASNFGKLFEIIINNRITPKINMTEAQAGGQKRKSNSGPLTQTEKHDKTYKTK